MRRDTVSLMSSPKLRSATLALMVIPRTAGLALLTESQAHQQQPQRAGMAVQTLPRTDYQARPVRAVFRQSQGRHGY